MDTELITIDRTAMIPTRVARQITPMLFSGSNKAEKRFWEFFTATIRNPNTRMAYLTAAYRFADWCEVKGLKLEQVEPMMVAAYIEQLTTVYAPATAFFRHAPKMQKSAETMGFLTDRTDRPGYGAGGRQPVTGTRLPAAAVSSSCQP